VDEKQKRANKACTGRVLRTPLNGLLITRLGSRQIGVVHLSAHAGNAIRWAADIKDCDSTTVPLNKATTLMASGRKLAKSVRGQANEEKRNKKLLGVYAMWP
jgi:hypothetical protein